MGAGERREMLALGDTPNVAARVQAQAEPDVLLITAATQRLISGLFVVDDRGPCALKGVREPQHLYRVLRASGVRGRLHAAAVRGLTPFVGREEERRLLLGRWERACEGDGQVVLVTGEAGIGKSRLVQQFKEELGAVPHSWVECAGSPYLENTPFHAVVELLQEALAVGGERPLEERQEGLERAFASVGLDATEALPLVAPLVGLPLSERYPPLLLSPEQRRRKLMATLVAWVAGFARLQPMVVVCEDLHYVDPSTLELFGLLVERAATEPLLVLLTSRPEFHPPWPLRSHHAQVTLARLSRRQARELVERVTARAVLPEDVVTTVVTRTDGVPLFVEEFVRLLVEGEGPGPDRGIPSTLQDSLMARLDRLGSAKEVAQVAAVLGHEFSYGLLRAVTGLAEGELQAALDKLVDAELLYARGLRPEATYLFKHTLMQEAAYTSLLKSRRRELHRTVARTLAEAFPELAAAQPELLAHHHAEAGDVEPAVAAWQRAGERAAVRSALVEAASYYTRALHLLAALPHTAVRTQQELQLQVPLGLALRATRGWSSPDAIAAFARARELSEQLGDTRQLLVVLQGLWASSLTGGQLGAAQELADQMVRAAERAPTPALRVWPHVAQGVSRYLGGDPAGGAEELERAVALYDEAQHRAEPVDPGVAALSQSAYPAACIGLADRARQRIREGVALAQRLGRPYELALALMGGSLLYSILRDPRGVLEHAEPLSQIAEAQTFRAFLAMAGIHHGWALAHQGRTQEGIAQIRGALGEYLANEGRTGYGQYLGLLADAYLLAGDPAKALAAIEDGLGAPTEERLFIPELLRLRGEVLARQGAGVAGAEASFREAAALARRSGSKLMELRATTSLGRMLRLQGRGTEARVVLAPLYASFTEGFDTPDLVEAAALLAELG
jgi:hypothetical protein